jgi:signal transduction histidine kinase
MTKLNQLFPKDNFFLTLIYMMSLSLVVFGLNWQQLIMVFIIDTLALLCFLPIDRWLFLRCYPKFKVLHAPLESIQNKQEFYELLSSYPETRSVYCVVLSLLKVAPAGLYMISVAGPTEGFISNLALFYVADIFILFYFGGLLFIELHNISTDMMKTAMVTWGEEYRDLKPVFQKDKFSQVQNTLLVLMLVNFFVMSFAIHSPRDLLIHFAASLICIGSLQILFQNYFQEALTSLTKSFEQKVTMLPLHTSPILSNFEKTVNQLHSNIQRKDREIDLWIRNESEQFHLKTLGGVTAMVAHDIRTPLYVIKHSYEMMISETTSDEKKMIYRQLLKESIDQSLLFSQTLMAYVKGEEDNKECTYGEVHDYLLGIFKVQFFDHFSDLTFNVSVELKNLKIRMNRLDAMHVFYNLYQNAIKAVLEANINRPMISVWEEQGAIYIKDNGRGLKKDVFEKLVSFERYQPDHLFHKGLGLRLTNSMLEHLHGELTIEESDEGTCLKVQLPKAESDLSDSFSSDLTPKASLPSSDTLSF